MFKNNNQQKTEFKILHHQNPSFLPLIAIICIVALVLIYSIFVASKRICSVKADDTIDDLIQQNRSFQLQQDKNIKTTLFHLIKVVYTIAHQNELSKLLNLPDSEQTAQLKDEIERELKVYMSNFSYCSQIRYIDNSGNERIRINKVNDEAKIVSTRELQNKRDRYYFQTATNLPQGKIYISDIDLNVENGQIEKPYVPTLRFAISLFDNSQNRKGIIIINIKADYLINIIKTEARFIKGEQTIVDSNGYWICNPNKNKEWGFMLDKKFETIRIKNSRLWSSLIHAAHPTVKTPEGIFTARKVSIPAKRIGKGVVISPKELESPKTISSTFLTIISQLDHATVEDIREKSGYMTRLISSLASLIVILLSILTYIFIRHRLKLKYNLLQMAYYDELTGLPNRKMFYEQLTHSKEYCNRYGLTFAVLYIDLDHFKEVNDKLGHHTGDLALKQVADGLLKSIRKSDMAARLGGDEFAIMLHQLNDRSNIEAISKRIIKRTKNIGVLKNTPTKISASIGVSFFPKSAADETTLLRKADVAMYISKKRGKATYTIAAE